MVKKIGRDGICLYYHKIDKLQEGLKTMAYQAQLRQIGERLQQGSPDQYLEFLVQKEKIERILQLREEKEVLILGHNYMAPLVYNLSGEGERGDSLQLSQYAARSDKPIILFDGVRFMAETAKILNPRKKVLIADANAGCSLADPFSAAEVLQYKEQYPGRPVVLYINSYAAAKAEADYCCTSSNGLKVVQHAARELGVKEVIFLPDSLMGQNLDEEVKMAGLDLELIYPGKYDQKRGACEVHEQISYEMVRAIRLQFNLSHDDPTAAVLVHWECKPKVVAEADFHGSTSAMIRYVREHPELKRVYLGTECEMTANLQQEFPQIDFVRTCSLACQHMARITLDKILQTLESEQPEVVVPEEIRVRALASIERMLMIQ